MGLLNDQSSKYDLSLVDTLQNHLFEFTDSNGVVIALDLAAANIQRGRDHGFPAYIKYRQACGLKAAKNFQDLSDSISNDKINLLQSVYENVADIDLWVGGLAETPNAADALIGPTFSCIIAKQFLHLKRGNRFYYENGPNQNAGTSVTAFSLGAFILIFYFKIIKIITSF
jgi:peroxidase